MKDEVIVVLLLLAFLVESAHVREVIVSQKGSLGLKLDNKLRVIDIVNSNVFNDKIAIGDRIVRVNDIETEGLSISVFSSLLKASSVPYSLFVESMRVHDTSSKLITGKIATLSTKLGTEMSNIASAYVAGFSGPLSCEIRKIAAARPFDGCNFPPRGPAGGDPTIHSGRFLVMQRGSCSFATKALNAEASGAAGLIIINSDDQPFTVEDGSVSSLLEIPVAMVGKSDGLHLLDVIKDHDRMHSFGVRLSLEGERCSGRDRRSEIDGADAAEEGEEVKKPDKDGFKSDSARRSGDAVVQSSYPSTERVEGQIGEHEVVPAQPPIEAEVGRTLPSTLSVAQLISAGGGTISITASNDRTLEAEFLVLPSFGNSTGAIEDIELAIHVTSEAVSVAHAVLSPKGFHVSSSVSSLQIQPPGTTYGLFIDVMMTSSEDSVTSGNNKDTNNASALCDLCEKWSSELRFVAVFHPCLDAVTHATDPKEPTETLCRQSIYQFYQQSGFADCCSSIFANKLLLQVISSSHNDLNRAVPSDSERVVSLRLTEDHQVSERWKNLFTLADDVKGLRDKATKRKIFRDIRRRYGAWPDKIELLETIMFGTTTANNSPQDLLKSDKSMRTKRNVASASLRKARGNERKSAAHASAHNHNHNPTIATMTEDHRDNHDGRKEDMNDIPASVRDEL